MLKLVRQTAKIDRGRYHKKDRSFSLTRLAHLTTPNLKQPIFIIGAPRSGTTFLGESLAVIPEVSYHHEPVATKFAARYLYEKQWDFDQAKSFYSRIYSLLMMQHLDGDLFFAEKTPRNCFLVDFLARAFPDSRFIHIIRDGRDAAVSHSKKPWLQAAQATSGKIEPGGYPYGPSPRFWVEEGREKEFESTSDIHRCIWSWRRFTESALKSTPELPSDRYHELRYESLVKSPDEEAASLLDFLSINSNQSRSIFHQAISKASPSSVGQWQKELSDEQLKQIEDEAGILLRELNYLN
ncbi:sulfotransferase [Oscillatoria sp. CS-180]|nr:sulfotransferase [Oscillatoria sp. CS-180]MDB9527397.1 sulfotransferase [Oscillatoria sp. CS-180]